MSVLTSRAMAIEGELADQLPQVNVDLVLTVLREPAALRPGRLESLRRHARRELGRSVDLAIRGPDRLARHSAVPA